jgi:hypothetical protein
MTVLERLRRAPGHRIQAGGGVRRLRRLPTYWMRFGWICPLSIAACSSASLVPGYSAKK